MNVVIIDYQAGNNRSVQLAFERIGVNALVSSDAKKIMEASHVVFPGVGHAGSALQMLTERGLDAVITSLRQPVLGICLGMQLLGSFLEESSDEGLSIVKEKVVRFTQPDTIPHVGWSQVSVTSDSDPLFNDIDPNSYFYFLHSYFMQIDACCIAQAFYAHAFCAAVRKDNFVAVQFHPEKSGIAGEQIFKNFLQMK